ncbi:MAG: hypothetical protein HN742_27590 [Lentisphaerae bacterium]|jgi:hypothetical protein|nr:hypothetical protein [Lentisphaerota bacterium]MBT4822738.1 hypothetical protein [Lentisphaerota bacterium]MBT5607995.1 hypothetical protein [Lentisphaerota bacterium]MBT7057522.1 hypothetical protein [Lentisphaerota bacterium]MBT7845668.1 hypothetical protein [Lentisphaerota bacterium]
MVLRRSLRFCVALTCIGFGAVAQLSYEAENLVVNRDALKKDTFGDRHWNLWSTDKDAMKKWSGGVVLQSPVVKADRATPEEGAPPLHLRIVDVPKGVYTVEILGPGRVGGLSFDGKTWQRFSGGRAAHNQVVDGTLEFWFDDRYAMKKEGQRGSTYLDRVVLTRAMAVEDGVGNPGFEATEQGKAAGWSWWSRDNKGRAVSVEDAHSGKRAVHIAYEGEKDWAFSCGTRLPVAKGQEFAVRAWVKSNGTNMARVDIVGCRGGKTVTWSIGGSGMKDGPSGWQEIKGYGQVHGEIDTVYVRFVGRGKTDVFIDDVSLRAEKLVWPAKPKVKGWAAARTEFKVDRGLAALPTANGVYLSWRLLKIDPPGVGFDVFRSVNGKRTKLNAKPITRTCDFPDRTGPADPTTIYEVTPTSGAGPAGEAVLAVAPANADGSPYLAMKLKDEATKFKIAGFTDLDGDGAFDIVIKHPAGNVDPWHKYWKKSTETFKIEAYLNDGTHLWTNDLGWAIERGVWYSPWVAADLTGDGQAEVMAKIGEEGDPRDEEGKVTTGPEWIVVWDGMTGEEITRAPWPSRGPFPSYNYYSRNQIAVAYLDGKTPCLLALRGTYNRMFVLAFQLKDGKLETLWEYDNKEYGRRYWGQGAHFTLCHDVDADGRDEIILGSAVLDDTGVPLWSTGKGHPDAAYLTDVDLQKPGLELAYVMETRQRTGGLCLADAASGELLWELDHPTGHVHGKGMCADIDPTVPGMEVYGADADGHKLTKNRWLFAADGTVLKKGEECTSGFSIRTGWWDADLQRELVGGRMNDYQGGQVGGRIEGSIKVIADVIGDWREEVITSVAGELRIYSTTIPAADRRVCLMQDPVYAMCMRMNTMGYSQALTLSYNPEAVSPGLNLSYRSEGEGSGTCRVVVSAPLDRPVVGSVKLIASEGMSVSPAVLNVALKPGERLVKDLALASRGEEPLDGSVDVVLEAGDGLVLTGQVPVRTAGGFLKKGIIVEAEEIAEQSGGEVQIRKDKRGVRGKAISHWDEKKHTLAWKMTVAEHGMYQLVVRYSTPKKVTRRLSFGNRDYGLRSFPSTGGFGNVAHEWEHVRFDGDDTPFALPAGDYTVRLENTDGNGLNLDYLALVRVD